MKMSKKLSKMDYCNSLRFMLSVNQRRRILQHSWHGVQRININWRLLFLQAADRQLITIVIASLSTVDARC